MNTNNIADQPSTAADTISGSTTTGLSTHSLPSSAIPNRRSLTTGTGSMPEQGSLDPALHKQEEFKEGQEGKSRSASVASSKKEAAFSGAGGSATKEGTDTSSPPSPKAKKRGGFLSFLNCCSAPENANSVELGDQAVPAKKAKVLQHKPMRQNNPLIRPSVNAGKHHPLGETKQAQEESIGGPEYSELKQGATPKILSQPPKEEASAEKNMASTNNSNQTLQDSKEVTSNVPTAISGQPPLPPLPATAPPLSNTDTGQDSTILMKNSAAAAEAPQFVDPGESVAAQGTTINDRTPKQEAQDSDVAMTDAPSIPALQEEPVHQIQDAAQMQMSLPPPPPRNGQNAITSTSTTDPAATERREWLLPPLQPRFQGRKCLVLDLDETLVHSSFKVRSLR